MRDMLYDGHIVISKIITKHKISINIIISHKKIRHFHSIILYKFFKKNIRVS